MPTQPDPRDAMMALDQAVGGPAPGAMAPGGPAPAPPVEPTEPPMGTVECQVCGTVIDAQTGLPDGGAAVQAPLPDPAADGLPI